MGQAMGGRGEDADFSLAWRESGGQKAVRSIDEYCSERSASTGLIGNEGIATFLAIGREYMTQVATAVIELSGYESPLHREHLYVFLFSFGYHLFYSQSTSAT